MAAPDDAAKPVRKKPAEAASASGSGEGRGGLQPGATDAVALPKDWKEIAHGCLVLASIDRADGWWPAIITEDKGDGLFVLQWQDYSDWDLSREFASIGRRGRSQNALTEVADMPAVAAPRMPPVKTMADPYEHVVDEIRVKTRDFR